MSRVCQRIKLNVASHERIVAMYQSFRMPILYIYIGSRRIQQIFIIRKFINLSFGNQLSLRRQEIKAMTFQVNFPRERM